MLVSTILCCHVVNDQLHTSIKSIINQTYNNHELIILFDNPDLNDFINLKNKTIEYESKIKIIFLQNDKNYGLTYSLNKAIKHSSGSLIMRQDSDDISINTRMQTLVDYLINNPQKDLVYSNVIIINDKNKIVKNKKNYLLINSFFSSYNFRNSISHPSIMFRKEIFLKINSYDLRFLVSQDYDLVHRFIKNSRYCVGKAKGYLYKLRYSKNSISSKMSKEQLKNSVIIIFINTIFNNRFQNLKDTTQMFKHIEENMKTNYQFAIYYSYLTFKKIPLKLKINLIFLIFLFYRYIFHPNLLLKRLFK
tara:strand:+ start:37 stop:954 length:918 start_codon:yes stop_codon:yes gene_type:complete